MNPMERTQKAVYFALTALAYCVDIPVILWRPRVTATGGIETAPQIASKVENAVKGLNLKGGKAGVAIIVFMPVLNVPNGECPGPDCNIGITAQVTELPIVNMGATGTQKTAEEVATTILTELHQLRIGEVGTLVAGGNYQGAGAITPRLDPDDTSGQVIYDVKLELRVSAAPPARVGHVSISGTAGSVTLSTPTGGATIYYTTNGTFPSSDNTAATLYAAPFAVPSGTTIEAAAYKTGLSQSQVNAKTVA
jgi:hypothetical protein